MIQHTYIALITLSLLLVIMRWRKMAISNYNNMRPVAWIAVLVCVLQVVLNFVFHDPSCVFFNRNNLNDAPVADGHQSLAISTPQSETAVVSRIATRRGNSKSNELPVLERYYDVCVVGAGLSGSVISERYANLRDANVLIVERRDHIGGNCYDYIDQDTGIRVSKYGAHLFHTYYGRVKSYVQQFSEWTKYEHEVQALIDGKHVPVPVGIDTVNALFNLNITSSKEMDEWLKQEQVHYDHEPANSEEMALSRVGRRLYQLIFHPYTIKQWDKEPKDLGPEVTARIPVRNDRDPRYFSDPFQALPTDGYTKMFENMLENSLITVVLNTDFFEIRDKLKCGKMYYTGHIDRYFADLGWKKLEYRSLDFDRKVIRNIKGGYFQPKGVINHPNASVPYTRIVEYKHFLNQPSDHTILFYEYSKDSGEPYYPVPNPENKELYAKYQGMADKESGVSFVGRLANYKYFNMDQSIENALSLFDKETSGTDLIVHYCDQDISWLIEWQSNMRFSKIFMYQTCGKSPKVDEKQLNASVAVSELPKTASNDGAVWFHHMLRKDIQLAGQNIFVQGQPATTLQQLLDIMSGIRHAPTVVQFADLSRHPSRTQTRNCWTMNALCAASRRLTDLCQFHKTFASTGRSCREALPTLGGEFYVTAEAIRRNVVAKRPLFESLSKSLLKSDQDSLDKQHFLERCWGEILNS